VSTSTQTTISQPRIAAAIHTFPVALPGPLDIPASLELFRRSGDDMIDRWDGATLVRTLRLGTRVVPYACAIAGTVDTPALHVTVEDAADQRPIEEAIGAMFIPAPPEFAELLQHDPVLAELDARYRGLRQALQFELFAALIRCISAQQVNLRWAVTTRRRLAESFGERHEVAGHTVYSLDPARIAALDPAKIRALQFTTRKAEYIVSVARHIADGGLDTTALAALPDDEVDARLTAIRGIGRWSAEWILARVLGRPCVVAGDLAVRKVVGSAYLGEPLPSESAVRAATAHWGASAGVAQVLLLQGYSADTTAT
jgi:DNA-3-methyladenine glycosylase II